MHLSFWLARLVPILIGAFCLGFSPAQAARVEKVSGKQVLIDGEGEELVVGDKYFILIDGKKKGVAQITKFKNGKAIGKLTKGKAAVDATVESTKKVADGSGGAGEEDSGKRKRGKKSDSDDDGSQGSALFVGALLGFGMNAQTVKDSTGASVSMSGNGFSLKGYGDMPISGRLGLIGRFGVEQLSVKGTVGSRTLKTDIMYATADLLLRYSFSDSGFIPFVAGGMGLYFPVSKSSDVLDVPRISSTTVFFFSGGFNMASGQNMIYTVVAEYGLFPPSNDVSTNIIALRGGAGWRF